MKQRKTILLIEDDPDMSKLISHSLIKTGLYTPILANNQTEAIQIIKNTHNQNKSSNKIDCILIDLDIPLKSFSAFLNELFESKKAPFLKPIIIFHKNNTIQDWMSTAPLNKYLFCDYIKKPFSINNLLDKINLVLSTSLFKKLSGLVQFQVNQIQSINQKH